MKERLPARGAVPGAKTGLRSPPSDIAGRVVAEPRLLELQRIAGNRATARLLRDDKLDVKGAAKKIGVSTEKPPSDQVDAFLDSRTSLFKVVLAGTSIRVTIPRDKEWTERYTDEALALAATTAAIRTVYGKQVSVTDVAAARQRLISASEVTHQPEREKMTGLEAVQTTLIDNEAFDKLSNALGLTTADEQKDWRTQRGQAAMLSFALASALRSFDRLEPLFDKQVLEKANINTHFVKEMLEKRFETMVQVAKYDPAAKPWREAFAANRELTSGARTVPKLDDFNHATLSEWADAVLRVTLTARRVLGEQFEKDLNRNQRNFRNEYLRPHVIKLDAEPTEFIAKTFDGEHSERLDPYDWVVKGGMHLTNARNQKIYLLQVNSQKVIFQNEEDGKFYEQSLEGLGQEILYGIYSLAGQKSLGAIKITQWVIGVAGAVFTPVRIVVMATDVINGAAKIEAHKQELESTYDEFKIAYGNIDTIVPGVMAKIWDAVMDKELISLINPFANANAAAWFKALVRMVVHHYALHVARTTYVAEAVDGLLNKLLAAAKKGLHVLVEIVIHLVVLVPPVAGSAGVHDELDAIIKKLEEIHVVDVAAVATQLARLSKDDRERLVNEIDELQRHGQRLGEIVHACLEW